MGFLGGGGDGSEEGKYLILVLLENAELFSRFTNLGSLGMGDRHQNF